MAIAHVSPYSGQWFPADPIALEELLDQVFSESKRRTGSFVLPRALGFVVPHAAPVYSGTVAAAVYRHLQEQRPRRVVLLGFSHSGGPRGVAIPVMEAYRTPLGDVPVDNALARQLIGHAGFRSVPEATVCDHSVEIQLPLLQKVLPDLTVLPLYVGRMNEGERREAAQRLAGLLDAETVLVASSDLTHFGRAFGYQPFPTDHRTRDRLRMLDQRMIAAAGSLDPELFLGELAETGSTVCGYHPIGLLLETLRQWRGEEVFQETLDYQTSGDITGDFSQSVSYGALGYFPESSFLLSAEDGAVLLDCARRTIEHYQQTGDREPILPSTPGGALSRRAGVFVTLFCGGKLRGCIGRCSDNDPLQQAVPELALAAALEDPRFEPLRSDESGIDVEVSILTPMKRIREQSQFRPGLDGATLEVGPHRALLLPQVAVEYGLDHEGFMTALARKAGVSPRVYAEPEARLSIFRAQKFASPT